MKATETNYLECDSANVACVCMSTRVCLIRMSVSQLTNRATAVTGLWKGIWYPIWQEAKKKCICVYVCLCVLYIHVSL